MGRAAGAVGRATLLAPLVLVGLTYAGYPAAVLLAARRSRARRAATASAAVSPASAFVPGTTWPSMTVLVAALDEQDVIAEKIGDLRRQDYPGPLRVVVVADGSTDRTVELATAAGAEVLHRRERHGKSAAVNRGLAAADTDLVVLTDANCFLSPGALCALAVPFADPRVAVVGGVKMVGGESTHSRGEGLYWRYETAVKLAESELGVVPGAVGELTALRRSAVAPIPAGVINDDYHLACAALAAGHLVLCAADARTVEAGSASVADEVERRSRVAAGTWQTTLAFLRLLDPRRGTVAWVFAGHRVLRTVLTPAALPLLLATSGWQARPGARAAQLPRVLLAGQVLLYTAALASLRGRSRWLAAPYAFASINLMTLRGGLRLLIGRQPVAWARVARATDIGADPGSPADPGSLVTEEEAA